MSAATRFIAVAGSYLTVLRQGDGAFARCQTLVFRQPRNRKARSAAASPPPAQLPRKRVEYDPADDQTGCRCSACQVMEMVRWIQVKTADGTRKVLTFRTSTKRAGPDESFFDRPDGRGAGRCLWSSGSCVEYLRNTILSLDADGIKDRNLARLQGLVAQKILNRDDASRNLPALSQKKLHYGSRH